MTTLVRTTETLLPDPICAAAQDVACAAALADHGPEAVGVPLGLLAGEGLVVTHRFACTLPGYPGWEWYVSVTRVEYSRAVTIDEVTLAPGPDALVAPTWVPWSDRLHPGDLSPGAVVPTAPDDARLTPGWSGTDELASEIDPGPLHPVNWEPGLQRARVPSAYGRESAAARWYNGEHGPRSSFAKAAPGECASCGWLLTIGGPLGQMFGVCSNLLSPADGRVVSLDHGCGAHSEASPDGGARPARSATVVDDLAPDDLEMGHS